jgi:hypothetical protein
MAAGVVVQMEAAAVQMVVAVVVVRKVIVHPEGHRKVKVARFSASPQNYKAANPC